jgi:osmotically-inducible protein OsmY
MVGITPPGCDRPPEGGNYRSLSCSFRLKAEVLLLVVLLSACAAATSRTNDDLTTTTQVKIALLSDAQAGGLRLAVSTLQGVVTLSGVVKSDAEAQHAVAVTRAVHGVRRVTSDLTIQPQ